ncbi:hypothetical protein NL466_30640, partial [Klebsiella pneumoniae]|nr:hypothetical protein [Klebsiella pneumoniae]
RSQQAHLQGLLDTIEKALDPRLSPAASPIGQIIRGLGASGDDTGAEDACWPGHEQMPGHQLHRH